MLSVTSTTTIKRDLNGTFLHKEVSTNPTVREIYYGASDTTNRVMTSKVYNESNVLLRTKTTTMQYKNNLSSWVMGLMTYSQVQSELQNETPNQPILKRRSTFDYDSLGRKTAEYIRNPTGNAILHKTAYGAVDSYGRSLSVTASGAPSNPDFESRTSSVTYDSSQRYIASETNTLGYTVSYLYYPDTHINAGLRKEATDPNGLRTHFTYDSFGRLLTTTAFYGSAQPVTSTISYHDCVQGAAYCPTNVKGYASYYVKTVGADGSQSRTYINKLGNTVRAASLSFQEGAEKWAFIDTLYDERGNPQQVSEPYFNGSGTPPWNDIDYDALDRPIETTNAEGRTDAVTYNGLTVTSIRDSLGLSQSKTEVRDSLGNLVQVKDSYNKVLVYTYDAFGQLISTQPPAVSGLVVGPTTIQYDIMGRKTSMSDPDKGTWSYTYNGLGQLITQKNARNETTCMAYDKLGRMVKRIDNYSGTVSTALGQASQSTNGCAGDTSHPTATWTYDTATGAGIGQLYRITGPSGYQKTLAYNIYGSPTNVTESIGGVNYVTNSSYDSLKRVNVVTYPGPSNRLKIKHLYNPRGYLKTLKDNVTGTEYYRLNNIDARGNPVDESYGNGLKTLRNYVRETGYLETIMTGTILDPDNRQNLSFDFDVIGNLQTRVDDIKNFSETFDYDNLNRLKHTYADFGNAQTQTTAVTYDALGNIKSKTGVGNYKYGSSCVNGGFGPHAVCQIWKGTVGTKGTSYSYDANGNMLSGDGRSITWSLFDKPTQISQSGNSTQMSYGPERQLLTRADTTSTGTSNTVFVGGLYEKVTDTNGATHERHYVGGHFMLTFKNRTASAVGTKTNRYLHKDHIGSVVLITDGNGNEVESFSFDPWGKRRAATLADLQAILGSWASLDAYQKRNLTIPALTLASDITNKGFTGHEQLDGVNLIHMGGRVYDAEIGRFLSADPFVQDSTNLQALNRYSYVNNNPLSYTDPSGYLSLGFVSDAIEGIFKGAAKLHKAVIGAFVNVHKKILRGIGKVEGLSTAMSIGLGIACGPFAIACTAGFNAAMMAANGGTIDQVLTGAAVGMVSSGLTQGLGGAWGGGDFGMAGAAMIVGGSVAKAQGGKFIDGVKGAAVGAAISIGVQRVMSAVAAPASATPSDSNLAPEQQADLAKRQVLAMDGVNAAYESGTLGENRQFSSMDAAAKEVLGVIDPISQAYGVELGGFISAAGDGFTYGRPFVGTNGSMPGMANVPVGALAGYHTHPSGSRYFSTGDAGWVNGQNGTNISLYMSAHGQIRVCGVSSFSCSPAKANFFPYNSHNPGLQGTIVP